MRSAILPAFDESPTVSGRAASTNGPAEGGPGRTRLQAVPTAEALATGHTQSRLAVEVAP